MPQIPNDVASMLAAVPEERREDMTKLDAAIREAAPELPVKLWEQKLWGGTDQSIIGYGEGCLFQETRRPQSRCCPRP